MVEFSSASGLRLERSASRRQAVPVTHQALCWAPATDAHEPLSLEAVAPQGAASPRWQRAAFGSVNQTWFTAPRQQLRRALRPPVAAAAARGSARQPTLSALSTSVSRCVAKLICRSTLSLHRLVECHGADKVYACAFLTHVVGGRNAAHAETVGGYCLQLGEVTAGVRCHGPQAPRLRRARRPAALRAARAGHPGSVPVPLPHCAAAAHGLAAHWVRHCI